MGLGRAQRIGREALDARQARNLKRFEKKLPEGAEETAVSKLPNGNIRGRMGRSSTSRTSWEAGA